MNIDQTLNGFNNYIASQHGLAHLNRFQVEIPFPQSLYNRQQWKNKATYNTVRENLKFTVRSTNLPSKTLSTNAVIAAGPEQKYPYQDVYDDLTVTILVSKGKNNEALLPERLFFEEWMNSVVDGPSMLVGFPEGHNGYSVELNLSLLSDERGSPSKLVQYGFSRTYPIGLGAIEFSHDSEEHMTFEVTFSYDKWYRVNIKENAINPSAKLNIIDKKSEDAEDFNNGIAGTLIRKDGKAKIIEGEFSKPKIMEDFDGGKGKLSMKDGKVTITEGDFKKAENAERKPKEDDSWKKSPIENKRVVGGLAPSVPTPKKFIQKIKSRATNLVKEKLGIRPMLDD